MNIFQASHYCSFQGSLLGKDGNSVAPPVVNIAYSSTMKTMDEGKCFHVRTSVIPQYFILQACDIFSNYLIVKFWMLV